MGKPFSTTTADAGRQGRNRSHAIAAQTMRRYALALSDAIRITLRAIAAGISGWVAWVAYYAPDSFMPLDHVMMFFDTTWTPYGKLSLLGGIIFSAISFTKYGRTTTDALDERLKRLISSWAISLLVVVGILFLLKTGSDFSRGWMIVWAVITPFFLIVSQKVEGWILAMLPRLGFARQRIAIVGATSQASRLLTRFQDSGPPDSFELIGVFDDGLMDDLCLDVSGSIEDLKRRCQSEPIDAIIIALPNAETKRINACIDRMMELPADIFLGPDLAQFDLPLHPSTHLGSIPVMSLTRLPMRDWRGIAKWLEDKMIVLLVAILVAPLLALTALLIKMDSPGPVLFRQRRFGFNNVAFDVYKFRTMEVEQSDPTGVRQTSRHDGRITRLGRFLRRTSIDELPQLINVWRGDMSIVGPRAHPVGMMVDHQPYHEMVRHYAARHRVKPGITGLAQVNGNRGEVTTKAKAEKRVHYDLFYIENWSIWLDLSILARTFLRLPFDRSAY